MKNKCCHNGKRHKTKQIMLRLSKKEKKKEKVNYVKKDKYLLPWTVLHTRPNQGHHFSCPITFPVKFQISNMATEFV